MTTPLVFGTGTGSSGSFPVLANGSVGDTVVGKFVSSNPSVTLTITDSKGNVYGFDIAINSNGDAIFRAPLSSALVNGTDSLSFSTGGVTVTYELSAVVMSGSYTPDGTVPAFTPATGSNTSKPSVTVPNSGDVLYGAASMYSSGGPYTATVAAPFTLGNTGGTSPRSGADCYQDGVASGPTSATFSWSASHSQSSVLIPYASTGVIGTASFTAGSSLSASGTPHVSGSVSFSNGSSLSASGSPKPIGTVTMSNSTTLTAIGSGGNGTAYWILPHHRTNLTTRGGLRKIGGK